MVKVCVDLDKQSHAQLKKLAKSQGKYFSHFVREILKKELERINNGKSN